MVPRKLSDTGLDIKTCEGDFFEYDERGGGSCCNSFGFDAMEPIEPGEFCLHPEVEDIP